MTHGGTYALAIGISAQGSARGFYVGLNMCGGNGYLPSGSRTISAWFYLSPSSDTVPPPSPTSGFGESLNYTNTSDSGNAPPAPAVGSWFHVSSPLGVGTQLIAFSLHGFFGTDGTPATDWDGVVYVDDITIQ